MNEGTEKRLDDLTDEEFKKLAHANHLWLNGFACINPTDEFLKEIGRTVIQQVKTAKTRDCLGVSQMTVMTVNIS